MLSCFLTEMSIFYNQKTILKFTYTLQNFNYYKHGHNIWYILQILADFCHHKWTESMLNLQRKSLEIYL